MKRKESSTSSATDLADMGFCELKVLLKLTHSERPGQGTVRAREAGVAEHARFHDAVVNLHDKAVGKEASAQDRRCFIASALYGPDDIRTDQLREWRDRVLLKRWYGRTVVRMYYRWSPACVRWVAVRPWIGSVMMWMLDGIRHMVVADRYRKLKDEQDQQAGEEDPGH